MSEYPDSAFTAASTDNLDYLHSYARVYCGKQHLAGMVMSYNHSQYICVTPTVSHNIHLHSKHCRTAMLI